MLAPHHREDAELGQGRRAAERLEQRAYSSGESPCSATISGVIFCVWLMRLEAIVACGGTYDEL